MCIYLILYCSALTQFWHPTAFAKGMCYEPFVKYGNFSSSDSTYGLGAVVEFSCDPGYTLEQGSVVIECVDAQNPQWNETEPACRGESTDFIGFSNSVTFKKKKSLPHLEKNLKPDMAALRTYTAFIVSLMSTGVSEVLLFKH